MDGVTSPLIGFKRHLRAAEVPGEAVYLTSDRGTVAVSGGQIEVLAPLLDGTRSLADVQRETASVIPPDRLGQLLTSLTAANLIGRRRPETADTDAAAEAYWDLAGLDADDALAALTASPVRLLALGGVDPAATAEALRALGLTVVADDDAAVAFTLVLCADYLDPGLDRINAAHLVTGRPWLLAKPTGVDVWLGPVFQPGGPCWSCVATRLRGRRRGAAWLGSVGGGAEGPGGAADLPEVSLPLTRALGLHLTALEATKWLAGWRDDRQDALWTWDTLTLAGVAHPVRRRPQCPACGDPDLVTRHVRRPVKLVTRPKAMKAAEVGNGHRALTAEQMWDRYRHLADPLTGITDPIRRDSRGPAFLHAYVSGPNLAVTAGSMPAMRAGLRQQAGGKGSTDLEARVGALCEAVERYCGSRLGDEPTLRASFRELGEWAVHPDTCQLFDPRQYRDRAGWNARSMPFQQVPEPFDDHEVLDWTPVWSLTESRHRLLPTDLLYFRRDGHRALRATSNGNAAGASLEDAVVQGTLELIERDAVALWWYNRTRHAAVDLDSFYDPWLTQLREQYAGIGREFWVLDVTADLGVPVMAAVSRRVDKPAQDLMLGFGAHLDPHVALRRALTELGQLLPAVAGARPDGSGYDESSPHLRHWWRHATVDNQPYLTPDPAQPPRDRAGYGYQPHADLHADLRHLTGLAAERGLEVLVLDQTRPDVGMPVAKVVIPGLRHFWARFAPGRLFDVPVRLGRRPAPIAYEDLNPVPLFL
ncbi:TOMM precursor leader peptide-binding protein [Krasilnikovia sp. M28-CT-15]|uniref:TOMM precursor leader peptide-binding protein n=1 Tax=Krasilnikovia sp. M28-CT-15 TaxID=3373540 RepID=UPI003875C1A4